MSGTAADIYSLKKTIFTALVGAGALAGAGLLAYFACEDKIKNMQKQRRKSSSSLTVSDLPLSASSAYRNGLNGSQETVVSLTSFCSERNSFYSVNSMSSTSTKVNSSSKYCDAMSHFQDEINDLTVDDELLAEALNEKHYTVSKNKERALFDQVDSLMKGGDDDVKNAYNLLKSEEMDMTENPDFLWRFAKVQQKMAIFYDLEKNREMKKKLIYEGLEAASKAVALDTENPEAHKWYAILTGMTGDFVSLTEKTNVARTFYKHLHLALERKPNDYSLYHLLARFYYEVANASWFEKRLAAKLLNGIVRYNYSDAIPYFLKSEELNSNSWKGNRLMLAKCYIGTGDTEEAKKWLNLAEEVPCVTKEDKIAHKEVLCLLEQYR